jgi:hypothetical protein
MSAKNKRRGTTYERKCVERAKGFELKAERTWGSDGRSRGLHQEVDMVIEDNVYVQCKKRKVIAEHLKPIPELHVQFVGEDRGEDLAVMRQDYFLLLLSLIKKHIKELNNGE